VLATILIAFWKELWAHRKCRRKWPNVLRLQSLVWFATRVAQGNCRQSTCDCSR